MVPGNPVHEDEGNDMDSVLAEIYSTVLSGAPYVIAAYALLWVVLLIFVVVLLVRFKKVEKEIEVLSDAVAHRSGDNGASTR